MSGTRHPLGHLGQLLSEPLEVDDGAHQGGHLDVALLYQTPDEIEQGRQTESDGGSFDRVVGVVWYRAVERGRLGRGGRRGHRARRIGLDADDARGLLDQES